MTNVSIDKTTLEQVLGSLVRSEAMHGQPNFDLQEKLRKALSNPTTFDLNPALALVLISVEEAIKNGDCTFQIEQAFDEYEIQRRAAIHIESLKS